MFCAVECDPRNLSANTEPYQNVHFYSQESPSEAAVPITVQQANI